MHRQDWVKFTHLDTVCDLTERYLLQIWFKDGSSRKVCIMLRSSKDNVEVTIQAGATDQVSELLDAVAFELMLEETVSLEEHLYRLLAEEMRPSGSSQGDVFAPF